MALELYLNGMKADLKKGEVIAITKQIIDINTFDTIKGDRSNSFNLPPTDLNKRIVEFIQLVGSQSNLPYIKVPAKIIQDGVNVLPNAFASIDAIDLSINIAVFGGNVSWIGLLEGKTLQDLDFTDSVHLWNKTNIIDSHQLPALSYLYPLVDYRKAGGGTISNWSAATIRPWVYYRSILDRIFSGIGFTFSGEFLTDPRFMGALIECSELKYPLQFILAEAKVEEPAGYIDISQNPFASSEAWLRFPKEVSDPLEANFPPGILQEVSTIFGPRFQYNYKKTGKYYWEMKLNVVHLSAQLGPNVYPGSSPIPYCIKVLTNIGTEIGYFVSGVPTVLQFTTVNTVAINVEQILITPLSTYLQPGVNIWNVRIMNDSYIKVVGYEGDATTGLNDPVNPGYMLPKISQAEFVKMVSYQFGQAIIPDAMQNKVTFRSWDELVKRKGEALDWSAKVDTNVDAAISFRFSGWSRKNNFKYQPDETVPEGYGDGEIAVNDEWLQESRDVIVLPVSACTNSNAGIPYIPRYEVGASLIWNGESNTRVLTSETVPGSVLIDGTSVSPYRDAWFKKLNGLKNFGFEDSLLIDYYSFIRGVVNKAKIVRRNIKLNQLDMLTFDPFLPVYIAQDSCYYFVNKIENWQATKVTKTELIRL